MRYRLLSAGLLMVSGVALTVVGLAVTAASGNAQDTNPVSEQPSPAFEVVPFTDQACLDCHTDQAKVQTLAIEEEKPDSLSEGPG
jgi:hypothetical protein